MSIIEYRQAVIDKLKAAIPQFKSVEPHSGKFAPEDLGRLITVAPAAYVAALAAPAGERLSSGQCLFDVCVCVFIVTSGKGGEQADVMGWKLAEVVAAMAMHNQFGRANIPPTRPEIENLWSRDQDKKWLCIMGVAWDVQIAIGANLAEQFMRVRQGQSFQLPADFFEVSAVTVNPHLIEPTSTPIQRPYDHARDGS